MMLLKTIRGIWDRAGVPKLGQTRTEREGAEQCEGGKPQADSVEVKPLGSRPTLLQTSLPPSYFLQDCAQHETSRTPRVPQCKLLSFNFILSLVDFLLNYLLLPSNKLKAYRNVKKNSVLSKNLIYGHMTSLQSSIWLARVMPEPFVSFYFIIQSFYYCNNIPKKVLIGFFTVCGKGHRLCFI